MAEIWLNQVPLQPSAQWGIRFIVGLEGVVWVNLLLAAIRCIRADKVSCKGENTRRIGEPRFFLREQ